MTVGIYKLKVCTLTIITECIKIFAIPEKTITCKHSFKAAAIHVVVTFQISVSSLFTNRMLNVFFYKIRILFNITLNIIIEYDILIISVYRKKIGKESR